MLRRVAQVVCDRCEAAADLLTPRAKGGPSRKPVGWSRMTIATKVAADKPVKVTLVKDLCPDCVGSVETWTTSTESRRTSSDPDDRASSDPKGA